MKPSSTNISDDKNIIRFITSCYQESETAGRDRRAQDRSNFDCYHLKQDWSHKIPGQSHEFLALQMMATEQLSSFIKQGLVELDNWFDIQLLSEVSDRRITPQMLKKLLLHQFAQGLFYQTFEEALKLGLLNSLMIFKVHGKQVPKPKYRAEVNLKTRQTELKLRTDLKWQLHIEAILPQDYYPDPTGADLYAIHEMEVDWFELKKQCKTKENPNGIYDLKVVNMLKNKSHSDLIKEARRNRVKDQNTDYRGARPKVTIKEFWGTLLDSKGDILMENCVCTIANDTHIIRKPEVNPFWHQRKPFVVAPLVRVPKSVRHRALMDAPTRHNQALNEIYNLNLDNGLIAAYGIKQIRPEWLEDPSQVANGVKAGDTLPVNASMPVGAKVIERVDTATMSPEALQMFQLTKSELLNSALSNEARSGQASKDTKATEIVESSQTITSQLSGVATSIEGSALRPVLELAWMTCMQHFDDFDSAEMRKVLGPTDSQILASMSPPQRFAGTVNGLTFSVFGISYTLNKMRDFRRLTALLQTIFSNPVLTEQFMQRYDAGKLITEIMRSLDIEISKIENNTAEEARMAMARLLAGQNPAADAEGFGGAPDVASQIPRADGARAGGDIEQGPAPGVPTTSFPPSRATPVGSQGGPGSIGGGL